MRRSRLLAGPAALLLVLAACGDEQDPVTAPEVTTTGTAAGGTETGTGDPTGVDTATPTGSGEGTSSETAAPTVEPTGEATGAPEGERCVSPLGFSVVVPTGWVTNTGDVAPPCSYVGTEPFTVPEATDVRPTAINLFVDAVPFEQVSAERPPQMQREETTLLGQDAVRVTAVEDGSGFYEEGTQRTSWYVDLPPASGEDGPRTFVANAVAAPGDGVDYDDATAVLDRMMASLQLEPVTAASP